MFCQNCGTKNLDDAMFCENCGTKMIPKASAPSNEQAIANAIPMPVSSPEPSPVAIPAPQVVNTSEVKKDIEAVNVTETIKPADIANSNESVKSAEVVAPADSAIPAPIVSPVVNAEQVNTTNTTENIDSNTSGNTSDSITTVTPEGGAEKKGADKAINEAKGLLNKIKSIPKKFMIIGGAALALVVLVIIIASVALASGSKNTSINYSVQTYYDINAGETYVLVNNSPCKGVIDGDNVGISKNSIDSSVIMLYQGSNIFVVDCKKKTLDQVADNATGCEISANGRTIIYVDKNSDLYSYDVKSKKSKTIAEDVDQNLYVISPSGNAIAYVCDGRMYVNNGRKEIELVKHATPLALTDNMKYIYYYDSEKDGIYTTDLKQNTNKLGGDVDNFYLFNKDCTEIIFTTDNGIYISIKGGDKIKISSNSSKIKHLDYYARGGYKFIYQGTAEIHNVSSLLNQYYYVDDSVIFINKNFQASRVVNNISKLSVTKDYKMVYYKDYSDNLYVAKLDGRYEAKKIANDIKGFDSVFNGNGVYFLDDSDTMYYQTGNRKPKKICDDVDRWVLSRGDGVCYILCDYGNYDGTLLTSKMGGNKKVISDECHEVEVNVNATYITLNYNQSNNSGDVYTSYNGSKPSILLEEVRASH